MRRWLQDVPIEVRTAGGLLELCSDDVEKNDEDILMTRLSSILCDCFGEPYLYDFKKALACALEQLLLELNFLEGIPATALLLSPMVVDVPSFGRGPAHLIVFKLDISSTADIDSQPDGVIQTVNIMSDCHTSSSGSCKTTTPTTFAYTPRSLFDVSQSIMLGAADDIMTDVAGILKHLYPTPPTYAPARRTVLVSDRALVSTFSLDSFSEIVSLNEDPTLGSPAQLRHLQSAKKGLCAFATVFRSIFAYSFSGKRQDRGSGEAEGAIRSVGTSTLTSTNGAHLCSTIYPPSRNAMEVKPAGHPYLQPRVPSPIVWAKPASEHKRRTSSVISFVASDETVTNVS